jgi:ATP-dependent protease ClpP protease subunit
MVDEKQMKLRAGLMRQRTVVLAGEINRESTGEAAKDLLTLQSESMERINLLIDSVGGQNRPALQLCDFIEHVITAPVRGIAMGSCMSAATFVMLHCHERVSLPHARFLIHPGSMRGITISTNDSTPKDLELLLAESRDVAEEMIELYMRKLKKKRKEVEGLIRRGDQRFNETLSAVQAVEIGLVERIITENLELFPRATS